MKFKALPYVIAALTAASTHAATNISGDVNITPGGGEDGIVTIQAPSPAPVSAGTAPTATNPTLNVGPGATTPSTPGLIHTYSSNGSGEQTQTNISGGGIVANPNGNLTLNQQVSQTDTYSYTIETRELKVSNPAGYTDVAGTYGAPGTFYANGTTLPGSGENVATIRDTDGNLVSVLSDLPGVGAVTATDDGTPTGNPILTPAQVTAAIAAGAPAEFFTAGEPTITGGNLSVGGQTTTNGIDNSNKKITNVADATDAGDAVNKGQLDSTQSNLQDNINSEEAARIAADNAEASTRAAADVALQDNINSEEAARIAADNAEASTRAAADVALQDNINSEEAARIAADNTLQSNIDQEVAERSKLIRSVGQNADGNEIIHIGPHSLVTQELGGQQLLSAQNAAGDAIDIRINNGSNLIVDGSTTTGSLTVTGQTVTNGIDNSGARITNVGNAINAGDAVNKGQLDLVQTTLQSNINSEEAARILADDQIRGEFRAADAGLRNEFRAADHRLRKDIDKNTRGIAMVAAMTNTTVEAGKIHGFDFNVAQFESETGFSFGYANRLNDNVQLHTAAATSQDFEEAVARIGVSVQW